MPNGDVEALYAEVADEPRSPGPFFQTGGTFDEKLADLCQDIVEEYGKQTPTVNSEGEFEEKPKGTLEDPHGGGFTRPSYAEEISVLALEEFPVFFDAANIDRFVQITGALESAARSIRAAGDDGALVQLQALMTHWDGPTADNFENYLSSLGTTMGFQLAFVGDVGAATTHVEELMKRMRVDAYGLAKNLMAKVDPPRDTTTLTNVLLVAGLIAGGVATFGAGGLTVLTATAAVTELTMASVAGVVQIQETLKEDEVGDREIQGKWEPEYIPSCRGLMEEILTTGQDKADLVMGALRNDMSSPEFRELFLPRPEIVGARRYDKDRMTLSDGFRVGHVASLRRGGAITMPAMAQHFEDARESVSRIADMFTEGVGQSVVAGTKAPVFAAAAAALEEAFTHLRDDLYESGLALTAIADNYARTEQRHEDMMNVYKEMLDDPGVDRKEKYEPAK